MFLFFLLHSGAYGLEVVLPRDAEALCVECGFCEIAVVGLVVGFEVEVAFAVESPFDFEVADEAALVGHCVVAIAEGAVDEDAVIEEPSGEYALDVEVVPSFLACGEGG